MRISSPRPNCWTVAADQNPREQSSLWQSGGIGEQGQGVSKPDPRVQSQKRRARTSTEGSHTIFIVRGAVAACVSAL